MEKLYLAVTEQLDLIIQEPQTWLQAHGLNILFIISGAWLVAKITIAVVHGVLIKAMKDHYFKSDTDRKKRADTLHGLLSAVIKLVALLVACVMIADEIGINTGPLLASAGVLGVALGIGAQSFIKDFVSGIFIISENQYRVGDVVELEVLGTPIGGTVESITVRTTILRDINGTRHHIPNGNIVVASNKTFGFSNINESLIVDQGTNLEEVTRIINEVGTALAKDSEIGPMIKKKITMAEIGGYNERGITLFIRGSTVPGKQWVVRTALYERLQTELKKAKVKVPVAPVVHPPAGA